MILSESPRRAILIGTLLALSLILMGCGRSAEFGEDGKIRVPAGEPISIAVLQAFSMRASSPSTEAPVIAVDQQRGVEMAVEDRAQIVGHPVEISYVEDEFCSSEGGSAGATRIMSDPMVVGVIGTTCSEAALTASSIISEAGQVLISGSNTSPLLTSVAGSAGRDHHPGYYRTIASDAIQGIAGAHYGFVTLEARSAVVVTDGDETFSQPLAAEFVRAFESLGGTVIGSLHVTPTTDFDSEIKILEAEDPDMIYLSMRGEVMSDPVSNWLLRLSDLPTASRPILMGWEQVAVERKAVETNGMYYTGPPLESLGLSYDLFVVGYERRYGEDPLSGYSDNAYDATSILLDAIEFSSVESGGDLVIDLQRLREGLVATNRMGATGRLRCDEFGDCAASGSVPFFQVDVGNPLADFLELWNPPGQ